MSYGKLQANLSGQRSESGNLATFTLSITSTVRRPNFQTPVLSPGTTIWANVSDMVNLESVEHPQQHFMRINFLALLVILAFTWLSYNTVRAIRDRFSADLAANCDIFRRHRASIQPTFFGCGASGSIKSAKLWLQLASCASRIEVVEFLLPLVVVLS